MNIHIFYHFDTIEKNGFGDVTMMNIHHSPKDMKDIDELKETAKRNVNKRYPSKEITIVIANWIIF